MDLRDWDFLDDDIAGFLDFREHPGLSHLPTTDFHMNYFTCPAPNSTDVIPPSPYFSPSQLAPPVQLHLDQTDTVTTTTTPYDDAVDLVLTEAVDSEPNSPYMGAAAAGPDQYSVSQVFFSKTRDNEFADMKLDSPKPDEEILTSPRLTMGMKKSTELEFQGQKRGDLGRREADGGLNVWKWSLNGIGAICSFAMAAATIYVIVLGSHHGHKIEHPQRTHKLHFQIHGDDKRSKTNEAMSAMRGDHLSRAQIRTGGRLRDL